MSKFARARAAAIGGAFVLSSCGTYVPAIQEIPGRSSDGQLFVQAIVQNVACEVQNAVYDVINTDKADFRKKAIPWRQTSWLDGWGVQVTLNLTVDETSGINPTASWVAPGLSAPSSIFNLDGGLNLSADATRTDTLNAYYSVQELVKRRCSPESRPGGLFLMQSDLKLKEWLLYVTMLQGTGEIALPNDPEGPLKQNVISHEVKFVVVSSGTLTPGWKLTDLSINQSGSFLSAGRTRTHDLIITLGPMDKALLAKGLKAPASAAANIHFAAQIGTAITSGIRSGLLPRQ